MEGVVAVGGGCLSEVVDLLREAQPSSNPGPARRSRENKSWTLSSHTLRSYWWLPLVKHNWKPKGKGVQVSRYLEIIFPEHRAGHKGIEIESGGRDEKYLDLAHITYIFVHP